MKKIIGIVILCAAAIMAVSCKPAPSLTVSESSCDFPSDGGTKELTVNANYAWTAEAGESWISIETKSGTPEETSLRFKVSKNIQPDSREAIITVTCQDVTQTVKVVQAQQDMVVSVDGDEVSFPFDAQVVTLDISANVDYVTEVESSEPWISLVGSKALSSSTVSLSLEENETFASRTATLTFSANGVALKQISVVQEGHPQNLIVIHSNKSFMAPVVFGFGMKATIYWGDGGSDKYNSTLKHNYVGSGPFVVRVEATQATTASLSDLIGVEKVDLSGF